MFEHGKVKEASSNSQTCIYWSSKVTVNHDNILPSIPLQYSDFHCHLWYNQPVYYTYKYNLFRKRLNYLQY